MGAGTESSFNSRSTNRPFEPFHSPAIDVARRKSVISFVERGGAHTPNASPPPCLPSASPPPCLPAASPSPPPSLPSPLYLLWRLLLRSQALSPLSLSSLSIPYSVPFLYPLFLSQSLHTPYLSPPRPPSLSPLPIPVFYPISPPKFLLSLSLSLSHSTFTLFPFPYSSHCPLPPSPTCRSQWMQMILRYG